MTYAGLSRLWTRSLMVGALLFGLTNCDKGTDSQAKPEASAVAPAQLEVPTAQPPKIADQPVLAPPSLSPPTPAGTDASASANANANAKAAPSATTSAPAAATANPKATVDAPGIRPISPGPMAPRPAPEAM